MWLGLRVVIPKGFEYVWAKMAQKSIVNIFFENLQKHNYKTQLADTP